MGQGRGVGFVGSGRVMLAGVGLSGAPSTGIVDHGGRTDSNVDAATDRNGRSGRPRGSVRCDC